MADLNKECQLCRSEQFTSAGESISGRLNILNLLKLQRDRPSFIDIGKQGITLKKHLKNDVYLPVPACLRTVTSSRKICYCPQLSPMHVIVG